MTTVRDSIIGSRHFRPSKGEEATKIDGQVVACRPATTPVPSLTCDVPGARNHRAICRQIWLPPAAVCLVDSAFIRVHLCVTVRRRSATGGNMPLSFQVLGDTGRDNALLVNVDSGQAVTRLLFDCGDGCLWQLPFGRIQEIDHLFFSHLHMDHVGGFDTFFRCTYNRASKENHIWGPPITAEILQHRFRGFRWNLVADATGAWHVHDLYPDRVVTFRFDLPEAFAV